MNGSFSTGNQRLTHWKPILYLHEEYEPFSQMHPCVHVWYIVSGLRSVSKFNLLHIKKHQ